MMIEYREPRGMLILSSKYEKYISPRIEFHEDGYIIGVYQSVMVSSYEVLPVDSHFDERIQRVKCAYDDDILVTIQNGDSLFEFTCKQFLYLGYWSVLPYENDFYFTFPKAISEELATLIKENVIYKTSAWGEDLVQVDHDHYRESTYPCIPMKMFDSIISLEPYHIDKPTIITRLCLNNSVGKNYDIIISIYRKKKKVAFSFETQHTHDIYSDHDGWYTYCRRVTTMSAEKYFYTLQGMYDYLNEIKKNYELTNNPVSVESKREDELLTTLKLSRELTISSIERSLAVEFQTTFQEYERPATREEIDKYARW